MAGGTRTHASLVHGTCLMTHVRRYLFKVGGHLTIDGTVNVRDRYVPQLDPATTLPLPC